jgi:hypothetical protein
LPVSSTYNVSSQSEKTPPPEYLKVAGSIVLTCIWSKTLHAGSDGRNVLPTPKVLTSSL